MSELAQKSGSKHRKDLLRERDIEELAIDQFEPISTTISSPRRCEPPAEDIVGNHQLFWLQTRLGPWVMAWDDFEKQWELHGQSGFVSPEQAVLNGWRYLKKAEMV